ncbi:YlbF family regulator [Kyrpidia spormannii]|uniref:YlbF family regulator n=1 Tax=Kyrpidia spormannii TaxID=2055160 RepID=UPI0013000160|nr:YlbF family regulator [Kyrpidia spormannii]
MNPYDYAHGLARALRESEWYRNLKEAKERLEADPEALRMAHDIRRRTLELQLKSMGGQTVTTEEQEQLRKLQEVAMLHSVVRAYLEAESRLSVVMDDIQRILAEAIAPVVDLPGKRETETSEHR